MCKGTRARTHARTQAHTHTHANTYLICVYTNAENSEKKRNSAKPTSNRDASTQELLSERGLCAQVYANMEPMETLRKVSQGRLASSEGAFFTEGNASRALSRITGKEHGLPIHKTKANLCFCWCAGKVEHQLANKANLVFSATLPLSLLLLRYSSYGHTRAHAHVCMMHQHAHIVMPPKTCTRTHACTGVHS